MQITHFLKRNAHTSNLFKNSNILKLTDKVSLEIFKNLFTLATASHIYIIPDGLTQVALKYLLIKLKHIKDIQSI